MTHRVKSVWVCGTYREVLWKTCGYSVEDGGALGGGEQDTEQGQDLAGRRSSRKLVTAAIAFPGSSLRELCATTAAIAIAKPAS